MCIVYVWLFTMRPMIESIMGRNQRSFSQRCLKQSHRSIGVESMQKFWKSTKKFTAFAVSILYAKTDWNGAISPVCRIYAESNQFSNLIGRNYADCANRREWDRRLSVLSSDKQVMHCIYQDDVSINMILTIPYVTFTFEEQSYSLISDSYGYCNKLMR